MAAAGTHVGRTDVDLWSELVSAMEHRAGRPLTVVGALMTGVQTADLWAGGPVGRTIEHGDAGLLDISPRLHGYWADCANPVVFGGPATSEHRRYVDAAKAAFDSSLTALRPGRRCCDIHAAAVGDARAPRLRGRALHRAPDRRRRERPAEARAL